MMRLSELFSVGMLFFVQSAAVYCDVVCDGRVIYPGATHGLCGRTYEAGDERDVRVARSRVPHPDYLLRKAINYPNSSRFSCDHVAMGNHLVEILWCCTEDNPDDSVMPTTLRHVRDKCFTPY
ncbi:hypothetical protein MJO28_014499 [Puccinia striiformis f. sp. tritici]|uniref:Secreted protein n=3 Tax=Puccinia striiformis TaxID=27350 RepID=A0A0L0W2J5_9BASI|nr:hypothetical protein Pst134EA_026974 [Puccinia striiformis f. sp. tritici]KAI9630015.1 hypothetical protein KEM48_012430 [Puccinia striiformis f. sp. tritici PST-130]KNF05734.1 hypothetical protein PSTG_01134 [Puccinia striiformis f. sp. tritici PST-78]POV97736.1 hypothetical protein PSTT_14885 [Puccinia striiformis]KAH9443173.1 hypothetical protein Pst134EB_027524 [Puccinia striiformis f. sp. tritici]KAH9450268.1 hypothetical protein Pst134EA_026974 [Puccinia striiformis f. sp. tritici]